MNYTLIILATLVVAIVGIIVGFGLGIFGNKFKVEIDEREAAIRAALPGNNCGGCGFPGCDGLAKAINEGRAPCNKCPVGGAPVGEKIAAIMGTNAGESVRMRALVKCSGTCDKSKTNYIYDGIMDCSKCTNVPGWGGKACEYGCLGHGTCVRACKFDAIHVVDGVAVVDKEKCTGCGMCASSCPKKLIKMVPYDSKYQVLCNTPERGKDVREKCDAGCIGCFICEKNCPSGAITHEKNLPYIDPEKCEGCGICASKCPKHVIYPL